MLSRTKLVLGEDGLNRLKNANVAVVGIGGVGGHAAEALVRAGVGNITVVDGDVVQESNINRQIFALKTNVGASKVEAAKERLLSINPNLNINAINLFYSKENAPILDLSQFDYVVDAIDSVSSKVELIANCKSLNVPIISAMGAGNKLDPTRFEVSDIYKTSVCPLSKIMRKLLKERGIKELKVVYSKEEPVKLNFEDNDKIYENRTIGSLSFVPSVMGLIIAGEVVKDIALKK